MIMVFLYLCFFKKRTSFCIPLFFISLWVIGNFTVSTISKAYNSSTYFMVYKWPAKPKNCKYNCFPRCCSESSSNDILSFALISICPSRAFFCLQVFQAHQHICLALDPPSPLKKKTRKSTFMTMLWCFFAFEGYRIPPSLNKFINN